MQTFEQQNAFFDYSLWNQYVKDLLMPLLSAASAPYLSVRKNVRFRRALTTTLQIPRSYAPKQSTPNPRLAPTQSSYILNSPIISPDLYIHTIHSSVLPPHGSRLERALHCPIVSYLHASHERFKFYAAKILLFFDMCKLFYK